MSDMHRRTHHKNGFTLIELLIVIAILSILALLGIPRLSGFVRDSRIEEVQATGIVIGRAAEALIASDPSVSGSIDKEAIGPYLDSETTARIGVDYTVTVDNGVEVEYIGGGVALVDSIVYSSQSD